MKRIVFIIVLLLPVTIGAEEEQAGASATFKEAVSLSIRLKGASMECEAAIKSGGDFIKECSEAIKIREKSTAAIIKFGSFTEEEMDRAVEDVGQLEFSSGAREIESAENEFSRVLQMYKEKLSAEVKECQPTQ